jgi:hypothetical protein
VNVSSNTSNGTNGSTIIANFTENLTESDGGYNYTWGCMVTLNNSGGTDTLWTTNNNTFKVDLFAPTVNALAPANKSIDTDGSVTFTYNVSDNASEVDCSVILDSVNAITYTTVTKDTNQTMTLNNMHLFASDTLQWYVSCVDEAGRRTNSSPILTIDTYASAVSGSGSSGYNGQSYSEGEIGSDGVTKSSLRAKDTISFSLNDESHEIKIRSISSSTVNIDVSSSDVISRMLSLGQVENFDVDSDGESDLSVILNSIDGGKAEITFREYVKQVATELCAESWSCTEWTTCSDGERTRDCTDANSCGTAVDMPEEFEGCDSTAVTGEAVKKAPAGGNTLWWIVGIAIVAIVAFLMVNSKKK